MAHAGVPINEPKLYLHIERCKIVIRTELRTSYLRRYTARYQLRSIQALL